ncbi:unnamed protein product [Caenorhabditis brenneri]
MSKIFACIFPYFFMKDDTSNSSIREMSYHHVESVSEQILQKRIQKLEKEKESLVDMMIYQHDSYKNSRIYVQGSFERLEKRTSASGSYYKKIEQRFKKQKKFDSVSYGVHLIFFFRFLIYPSPKNDHHLLLWKRSTMSTHHETSRRIIDELARSQLTPKMSKVFACIFPFLSKSKQEDVKNTAFVSDTTNSSVCEMSYHHVESVSKKILQKRIQKLEKEKEALVEMMIYQHESYKKDGFVLQNTYQKKAQKNEKVTENYYKKIGKSYKEHQQSLYEGNCAENTYDYISLD